MFIPLHRMLTLDPFLISFILTVLIALVIGGVFHYLKQPVIVGYIVAGIIVGPHAFNIIPDAHTIKQLGDLGILLLLFFIGTKINFRDFKQNWQVPIFGTIIQIGVSVLAMVLLGVYFTWSIEMMVFFGFAISLSSTSVVINILESKKLLDEPLGYNVLGVLLVQDILFVPMLIVLASMGEPLEPGLLLKQGIGMLLILAFIQWLITRKQVPLPFSSYVKSNQELQMLAAIIICFGFAIVVGAFQLSLAFGAFLAGIYIARTNEASWIQSQLHSFVMLLMALFFIYIGILIDPFFVLENIVMITSIVVAVFVVNTAINGFIFRFLGDSWKTSAYAGAILAPIGEFSFFLSTIARNNGFIEEYDYQIIVPVIAITLLLGPFWIIPFERRHEHSLLMPTEPIPQTPKV